jgi:hypothetical protein
MRRVARITSICAVALVACVPAAGGALRISGGEPSSRAVDFTLTVQRQGNGSVTSVPAGINCGPTCSASYAQGTTVSLTPTPIPGWQFGLWGGACGSTPEAAICTVRVNAATTVVAAFIGVDVSSTSFGGTWTRSILTNGSVTVRAVASHEAQLTATVSNAAGKSVSGNVSVPAPGGPFTVTMKLPPTGFYPGAYGLRFNGTVLGRPFTGPLVSIRMTAPKEGVVSQAWVSAFGSSVRVKRLRAGVKAMTAYFVYAAKPASSSKVVATWYYGRRVAKKFSIPGFLPIAQATLRVAGGGSLPRGSYRCVLTSRGKALKTVNVRVG